MPESSESIHASQQVRVRYVKAGGAPSRRSVQETAPFLRPVPSVPVKRSRLAQVCRAGLIALVSAFCLHLMVGCCFQVAQSIYIAKQEPRWESYQAKALAHQQWLKQQIAQTQGTGSLEKRAREQLDYVADGETLVTLQPE